MELVGTCKPSVAHVDEVRIRPISSNHDGTGFDAQIVTVLDEDLAHFDDLGLDPVPAIPKD